MGVIDPHFLFYMIFINMNYKNLVRQIINEIIDDAHTPVMKYYAFDWDDNLMFMPTKIYLKDNNNKSVGMSTEDFAEYRTLIGNEDFNYEIAGLNIPVPDAIEFNNKRMDKYYEGSSETGNAPGGNAIESEANSRFNKLRKKQTLHRLKQQSYNKSPQPVFNEKSGQEKGKGIKIKLESTEDKKTILEMEKIKNLIGYNRKTQ